MSRPYGKTPRRGPKGPAAMRPSVIQINITGRHTLEQFSLEIQRAIAKLQDYGVTGLESFCAQLVPLDEIGAPLVLQDVAGRQVLTINIPDMPSSPPYRENEPGVGVTPGRPSPVPHGPRHPPSA